MALTTQTQWHGNPRPRRVYDWTENTGTATSPYYKDMRTVPLFATDWGFVPFAEKGDAPSAATDTAGPAAVVAVTLAGPYSFGDAVDWTFTGNVSGVHSDTYTVAQENGMSPEEVLFDISQILATDVGADGVVIINKDDARQMDVSAAGANATFTVTAWTVTPA